jgi:hypothetical protein
MRKRDAEVAARTFVNEQYPMYAEASIDLAEEGYGERSKSWSFGVTFDEEHPLYDRDSAIDGITGYVHADGSVEGLYGANPKAYEAYEREEESASATQSVTG